MGRVVKDLGAATAYAYAVEKGYTGTEDEFAELMASYADVAEQAADSAAQAGASATAAEQAKAEAVLSASAAASSASTASTKASEAASSASSAAGSANTATTKANEASTSATNAASSASAAATSATNAGASATAAASSATAASNAQTAAETAQGKAEDAQTAAEDAAASVSASAAQITQNTEDIADLRSALNTVNDGYYSFGLIPNKYILRDNGAEENYNGWSSSDFIPVQNNSLVVCDSPNTLPWGALYDKNKQYVSAYGWTAGHQEIFFHDGELRYFRISASNADMANLKFKIFQTVDTTLTKTGYPADAKITGDRISALEQAHNTVPAYYTSHLNAKEAIIRGHFNDCAYSGDGLVFLTDTHFSSDLFTSTTPTSNFNANNSFSLINDVINKCGIGKIIFGGDLVNSAPDIDTMLLCMASFGSRLGDRQPKLRYCVGNHEYFTGNDFGQTTKPTPSDLYGAGIKYNENVILGKDNQNTYFFDNPVQKIRYYVISCGRDTEVLNSQASWVMNDFQNVPAGYHVVLIGHAFLTDSMVAFRGQYQYILAAFDALKAKGQYWYDGVTYDYRQSDATPVCAITGHTHIDGSLVTAGGIPVICTTCDSYAQNYELVDGTPTKVPRTKGTVDEQAFDVYQFDFANRKIYVTRIGYGADREFSY